MSISQTTPPWTRLSDTMPTRWIPVALAGTPLSKSGLPGSGGVSAVGMWTGKEWWIDERTDPLAQVNVDTPRSKLFPPDQERYYYWRELTDEEEARRYGRIEGSTEHETTGPILNDAAILAIRSRLSADSSDDGLLAVAKQWLPSLIRSHEALRAKLAALPGPENS